MSVYWREWPLKGGKTGGAWYWNFMVDGQVSHERARNPDNPKQKAKTKKEAEFFESIAFQRVCQNEEVFKPKVETWTFARFVEEKYKPLAELNHRHYANGAKAYLKVLIPAFGNKRIDQITRFEIEQFKKAQRGRERTHTVKGETRGLGRPIKNKTVNLYLDCLSGIFALAVQEKLRADNPVDSVIRLEDDPQIKKHILTREQEEQMIAACRKNERYCGHIEPLLVCMVEGGFRPQEFFTMAKSQVDLEARTVTVVSYKTGRKRKRSASPILRVVPISDRALPYYQALMATEGNRVFPMASVKNAWATVTEAAGVPGFWLRWLRDTAKHRWEVAGLGAYEIALLLGHSSPKTTMIYSQVDHRRALGLMNALANFSQKEKGQAECLTSDKELSPTGT